MKFGIFYELQLPQALGSRRRAPAGAGRAGPGRAGRPPRARLRLGGRASLPRGILALLGLRGVPRRRRRAHQAHPARPRHPPGDPQLQPPRAHGRGHRHARPRLQRPRRARHRRGRDPARARRLQHPGQGEAGHVARGRRADRQHDGDGRPIPGFEGRSFKMPVPQRHPQARAEAASADVDGLHQPRHHQDRGEPRARRARLLLPRRGGGAHLEPDLLRHHQERRLRAARPQRQRQHRHGLGLLAA